MFCSGKCALRDDAKNVTAVTMSQGFVTHPVCPATPQA
jgi:hypothetical protein